MPSWTSHVQPEPNLFTPASFTCDFSSSRLPNVDSIAAASDPLGSPPPSGLMISQKNVWLAWPPALFRTAIFLSSGSVSRPARTDSTGRSAHSVPSSALLALST